MANPSRRVFLRSDERPGSRRDPDSPPVESSIPRKTLIAKRLHESQKLEALGSLAGGIAHDFNNILNILSARLGGWQTFQRMKKIDPGVSAILTSGFLPASRRAEYSASGVKASIRKPYSAEELIRRIGDVLPAR